jgi:cell division protein ZapE
MTRSPLEKYRALLESGQLQPDAAQESAAMALEALHSQLEHYRPRPQPRFGFGRSANGARPPAGFYIHGDVGRGKSALMDMFYGSVTGVTKRRVHFNAFMAETHQRIHEWRHLSPHEKSRRPEFLRKAGDDPIAPVAKRILLEATLICLDEFQVGDVADAMILGRLFEKLFSFGGVVVLTSNTAPERLYEGGLNRQLFLPFIALIRERLGMVELDGPRDYRLDRMNGLKVYNSPLGEDADRAMDAAWRALADGHDAGPTSLDILQRQIPIPLAADGVARFSFPDLCGENLGAADYLALARKFHTLLIDGIPRLDPEAADEARRFTLLIDTLYDEKVRLICSAAASPQELYVMGDNAPAFRRTASRLMEMQSADYLRAAPSQRSGARAKAPQLRKAIAGPPRPMARQPKR